MARLLLFGLLVVVLLSVFLPNTSIAWMRENWAWFHQPMSWIERADSVVNLVHAILFLLLGAATRLALPRWPVGRVSLSFFALGVGTELAQLLVPGRHARASDVVVDVVAGVIGWAALRGLRR